MIIFFAGIKIFSFFPTKFFFKNFEAKLKNFPWFPLHSDISFVEFILILIYIAFAKTKR